MFKESVKEILIRDLKKLRDEISFYPAEEKLWIIDRQIKNSAGNLCLHLLGNLNHFIGAVLGGSSYKRNREAEFTEKNIPSIELLKRIDQTIEIVSSTLSSLNNDELEKVFPEKILTENVTTGFFLIHLAAHLNYHLGQINYHRRLLS
jgi:uncharacterized damage-inducible protein DinB